MIKSKWILQQERDSNLRGIAYIVVAVIIITSIMTLRSCAYDSPSMVPAGVNVDNLRGEAQRQAVEVVK